MSIKLISSLTTTVRASSIALALVATAGLALAQQDAPTGKHGAAPAGQAHEKPAKPEGAPARPKEAPGVELTLPVKDLTADNASKVEMALAALSREAYTCPGCHTQQAEKGKCPGCGGELAMQKLPVLKAAKPMPDRKVVQLTANPGAELRLSSVERALSSASVKLDEDQLHLGGKAQLVFRGTESDADASALQKALTDSKLFQSVRAQYDTASKETRAVVDAADRGPTRTALAAALEKAGSKAHLADVVWGAPPPVATHAG